MFLDEARLVGALHHQYIAPVYEVGRDETGRYFLVMDYVRGETAEKLWKRANERGERIPLEARADGRARRSRPRSRTRTASTRPTARRSRSCTATSRCRTS